MPSYGQIRLRLSQLAPGIQIELIDGWMQDRYTQILDELPWKRLESESIFQSPPSYSVGTLTANQGSAAVTGLGTNWDPSMMGRYIRISGQSQFYIFNWVDATHGTLDRPYEDETAGIVTAGIGAPGIGYLVGDVFAVTGAGLASSPAQGTVTNTGPGGSVTGISISVGGAGFAVQNGVTTTAGSGAGTGLTINITAVGASSGLSYRIDQAVFATPDGCRIVRGVKALHEGGYPLELVSPAELNRRAPSRNAYGDPFIAAATWDNFIDPPQLQVELYPIPSSPNQAGNFLSFEIDYVYDPQALDPRATSASILPWTKPACIIAGVQSDVAANAGDAAKTQLHEARFERLLSQMRMTDHRQRGPQPIRLAEEYQGGHPPRYRRGPWHRGSPA